MEEFKNITSWRPWGSNIITVSIQAFYNSDQQETRWVEPRPQLENGRTGDKPICGFVPLPENQRHQSDCSIQRSQLVNMCCVLWTSGLRDYADRTCPKFWPPGSNFSEYMDPLELIFLKYKDHLWNAWSPPVDQFISNYSWTVQTLCSMWN